ncbi:MAG: AraC family transcriptional regulator [Armatimonadetes bacterium]|nr:AraC family transcriptional regulator [Armatimonadota bacterium]
MEPTFQTRPGFVVAGMLYRGKNQNQEIPRLWDAFIKREEEIEYRTVPCTAYGVCDRYDPATGDFDYLAGFGVDRADGLPEGMVSWRIPAQTYAVFPTILATLMQTIKYANHTWLPQSGCRRGEGPEFELYDEYFMSESDTFHLCITVLRE